ncbi:hypothetical protein ACVBEG_27330 [Pseudomonas sp. GG8]
MEELEELGRRSFFPAEREKKVINFVITEDNLELYNRGPDTLLEPQFDVIVRSFWSVKQRLR